MSVVASVRARLGRMGRGTRIALALLVLGGASFAAAVIYQFRPLVPFGNYVASYVVGDGEPQRIPTYEMLFRPNVVFVRLPDVMDYRWFTVDWSTGDVRWPSGPRTVPYLSHNRDMHFGPRVTSTLKVDDGWTISRGERELVFSNGRLTVTVQKP